MCPAIQAVIVNPVCGTISCCAECLDETEAVLECVVNDVLGYNVQPCDFDCVAPTNEATTGTNLGRSFGSNHHLRSLFTRRLQDTTAADADFIIDQCIGQTPGLGDTTVEQLASQANFFDCIMTEFTQLVVATADAQLDPVAQGEGTPEGGNGSTGAHDMLRTKGLAVILVSALVSVLVII
jgi:hypothetical protein